MVEIQIIKKYQSLNMYIFYITNVKQYHVPNLFLDLKIIEYIRQCTFTAICTFAGQPLRKDSVFQLRAQAQDLLDGKIKPEELKEEKRKLLQKVST